MKIQLGWANFVHNFNESSRYTMKIFSVLNFSFLENFVSFHFIYDWNLSLHTNIAVTYLYLELEAQALHLGVLLPYLQISD
jgi:hypothetical protein